MTSFDRCIPAETYEGVEYVAGDFFDDSQLYEILKGKDIIFHSISTISPGNSNQFYFRGYSKDFIQSTKLISALSESGGKLIFLSSGGTVYGNQKIQPIAEEATTHPINHYASLKLCIENVIRTFNATLGCKMIIARISNAYGPGQDYRKGVGFIDAAIRSALSNNPLQVYGKGDIVRDYIFIDDIVQNLYRLSYYIGEYDVFNVGTSVGTSQQEIIEQVREHFPDLQVEYKEPRKIDVREVVLDNSRLLSLGEYSFINIGEGIERHIQHLKKMFMINSIAMIGSARQLI